MNWYLEVLKKYAVFNGRARRKEYWMFLLFNILISIVLGIVDVTLGLMVADGAIGMLGLIYGLAVLLPGIGVAIRRLHDTNRSGWWLLIAFIPFIGVIVLLVFMVLPGTVGSNDHGPDPKAAG
jgi:uncharacterized membrane protein YhaH (DUF805 family)